MASLRRAPLRNGPGAQQCQRGRERLSQRLNAHGSNLAAVCIECRVDREAAHMAAADRPGGPARLVAASEATVGWSWMG